MARPHKQGLLYFPHDTDACNDDKVQSLMALYGTDGYAFYFILLEKVFRTENGRITCGSGAIRAGIAKSIGITSKRFEVILTTALEIGCFDKGLYETEGVLTSNGIGKRILSVNNLRLKDRERKDKYKDKRKRKRKAERGKPMENPTENPSSPLDTGISEDKDIYGEFQNVLLSSTELQKLKDLFKDRVTELIENISQYIASNPKGEKYKSHYATILSWERKNSKSPVLKETKNPDICSHCKTDKWNRLINEPNGGKICERCEATKGATVSH